jgi:hypothetical protein
MAIDLVPADQRQCCGSCDSEAGSCQLTAGHRGPHASDAGDAFLTWDLRQVSRWSKHQPALWLFDLPWAPGLQPQVARTNINEPSS